MSNFHPHPATARLVLEALTRYPLGLSMTELRQRTSRGGLVYAVVEGRNVSSEFSAVLEYLLNCGRVEQVLVGNTVRYALLPQLRYTLLRRPEAAPTYKNTYRPAPAINLAVIYALDHYPHGLSMAELKRRTSRGGHVYAIDVDGRNVHSEFSTVLEFLLDDGAVEQVLVGRGVRYARSESTGEQP